MISHPNIDPVIISFGPLAISWYSLSYVVSILLGLAISKKIVTKYELPLTHKQLEDFITWLIVGVIVGGRLGYVLLYDPIKYLNNPIDIVKTYEGGMSFHGGIVGSIIAAYFFCRKYKISFLLLGDLIATSAPIGLFFGRIANFINSELYGRVTDVKWGVIFPQSDLQVRHPSQIYEALLEGIVLWFIILYFIFYRKVFNKLHAKNIYGRVSGLFLVWYSVFRMIVENFREPDVQIGFILQHITMGHILSLPMLIAGMYLLHKTNTIEKKHRKKS